MECENVTFKENLNASKPSNYYSQKVYGVEEHRSAMFTGDFLSRSQFSPVVFSSCLSASNRIELDFALVARVV